MKNKQFVPDELFAGTDSSTACNMVRNLTGRIFKDGKPKAYVHSFGCQQNVSDGEHIKGLLCDMGYEMTDSSEEADFILFNTCAVREHAELKVYGNIGALKHLKESKPELIIAVCGCMAQQEHVARKIKQSYPYVDIVFGTQVTFRLPQYVYSVLSERGRVFDFDTTDNTIHEDIPVRRDGSVKAWLPIMRGCNNFCSYCIVPYVRGREVSRSFDAVVSEAEQLVADGYKEITLLGQNVNSYGKGLDGDVNFPKLLRRINAIDGDFVIRFMTSHPKDCTKELIDTIYECDKVAKHLHLPVQSGNDRVLKVMNRHYDSKRYLELIDYAKSLMPELSLTSDIIVGFPGETYEEFCDTLKLIDYVGYSALYTFIYSPRKGTPAAEMDDPVTRQQKGEWFNELLKLQEKKSAEYTSRMVGKVYRALAEDNGHVSDGCLVGRTNSNMLIEFPCDRSMLGKFVNLRVTEAMTWTLKGELV